MNILNDLNQIRTQNAYLQHLIAVFPLAAAPLPRRSPMFGSSIIKRRQQPTITFRKNE